MLVSVFLTVKKLVKKLDSDQNQNRRALNVTKSHVRTLCRFFLPIWGSLQIIDPQEFFTITKCALEVMRTQPTLIPPPFDPQAGTHKNPHLETLSTISNIHFEPILDF